MKTLNARFILALLTVLALTILPLPDIVTPYRPPWVLLFVLYIQFFLPQYFRVTWLFLLGMSLDVLLASVMGEHTFALLLTTALASTKARRFHFFSPAQQILFIVIFCAVYALTLVLIDGLLGYHNGLLYAGGTVLASLFFWPWMKLLADHTLSHVNGRLGRKA